MKKDTIVSDYYGGLYFIQKSKDKEITIFVVDDNEIYLNLLKEELSENPKFSVYAFTTGEECLNYLELNPTLVILDYHLDGKQPHAQKGDIIYVKIKEKLPSTEIVIVSSDHKLEFISDLREKTSNPVVFKDEQTVEKLKVESKKILGKSENNSFNKKLVMGIVILIAFLMWMIIN